MTYFDRTDPSDIHDDPPAGDWRSHPDERERQGFYDDVIGTLDDRELYHHHSDPYDGEPW